MARYEPHDHYFHRAKREGFAARSIYKLDEIDSKLHLIAKGARVLDLGASPGSWTQYAAKAVGERGVVVAIDKKPLTIRPTANVTVLQGDAFDTTPQTLSAPFGGGTFDVVLSDMAPATMGDRFVDQARSTELCLRALELGRALLRAGGNFVAKALEGESTKELLAAVKDEFQSHKLVRPDSTRKGSTEIFIVGIGRKRGPAGPQEG